jgi:release factor glutamine methyltransferase
MTLRKALSVASNALAAVSHTPRLDAEILMAHALGVSREALLLHYLDTQPPPGFDAFLARRLAHEPLAYITGMRDFWTITLKVAPGVLIPRPDSETLIESAVSHFGTKAPLRILDLGTGSGALLLAALAQWTEASGLGIDASPDALRIARENADLLGFSSRATLRLGNWAKDIDERFDLILCNPPYVEADAALPADVSEFEPSFALFAGAKGLDNYHIIIPQLPALIAPGGLIAVEIGSTQNETVSALFQDAGLNPQTCKDLAGRDRCILHFALGIGEQHV